jgi:DNA-binding transcriptional LysR family regulator
VERLLATAEHVFVDMSAALTHERPAIRIGVMPSAMAMVASAVAALDEVVDPPSVQLSDGRSDELLCGLGEGRLDMIVSAAPTSDPRFESQLLVEDDLLLVASSQHPLAQREIQSWLALTGSEIVHFAGGSIGELAAAALLPHGLTASQRYRVDQVESLYGLARSGLAVGILPRLYTHSVQHQHGIRLIRLGDPVVTRRIMLLHHRQLAKEHPLAADYGMQLQKHLAPQAGSVA